SMLVAQGVVMPRVIDLSLLDFWHEIRAGVVGGAVALPVLVAGRIALEDLGVPTLLLLLILGVVGVAVYAASLRLLFGEVWTEMLFLVARVSGRKPAVANPGA